MASPTPNKRRFATRDAAKKYDTVDGLKMKAYKCGGCTAWHLTSHPANANHLKSMQNRGYLKYFKQFKELIKK